jgi:hypothetical protein
MYIKKRRTTMTVSARSALAAATSGRDNAPYSTPSGRIRTAALDAPPVQRPRRIDVNDPGSALAVLFVQEVQEIYATIEPDYEAPMNTIFKVAEKHGLVATIDHCDEDYWTEKKQVKLLADGDLEGPFEVELFKIVERRGTVSASCFKVAWPDLRQVALVVPRKRNKR